MRYFYLAVIVILAGATVLFAVQNLRAITVSFFSWSLTLPIALVVAGAYALGMASGGSLLSFLRWTVRRAKKPAPGSLS